MYDSGISNGFPYSPNVGSTVMYKFPAQHGNSRTNSSKFLVEDRNAQQYSEFSCVRRMWNIIKMFLFGTTISALAVLCFWSTNVGVGSNPTSDTNVAFSSAKHHK